MNQESVDLACLKRHDQGDHECEVLDDSAEGAYQWEQCTKNPGHLEFIPANEFSIDHLPKEYQDLQVYEYIQQLSLLTVKITVKYTSLDRPDGYPFANFRGKRITHSGSGCIRQAGDPYERKVYKETCPCVTCIQSGNPMQMWWDCSIITAKHVVFNEEEAKSTVVEVFYDDEKSKDKVKLLYGVKIVEENTTGDRCEFVCVTHDEKLVDQFRNTPESSLMLHRTFSRGCYPTLGKENANLCVVISHPHGCSKQITIGHWKNCLKQGEDTVRDSEYTPWYESYLAYTYDTPTCPGSSGGSMLILGLWDPRWTYILAGYYFCHTHKSGKVINGCNENESCYWLVSAE